MFDLNKTPTPVDGEVNSQDSGTEKELHVQANSATSAAPKTVASSSRNYTFDPSDLAHLLIMVQDLPNDLPNSPNLMFLNSNHARLVPHTSASSDAPAPAAGDGAPAVRDVLVMPVKHGRVVEVWSRNGAGGGLRGNQNQASQCQTTMDLDCHAVSDGESDSCKPGNSQGNSNSKTLPVELDNLPDEIPAEVEVQYPWSPFHPEEAPLHTTLFRMSSQNLSQVSATKLPPTSLEEERRLRDVAFNASFKLETQRCTPTARCRNCLAFCQTLLPKLRLPTMPSLQEGGGPGGGSQFPEECPPVMRNEEDDEFRQARKLARHGPKSKSSEYRGVTFYKRTGRWEAHIWHEGSQVYLGASGTKEEAARKYDQAALMLFGPNVDINFKPESYQKEMAYLYKLSKEQLVIYLRRDSRGYGAQVSYPGVRHAKNSFQAMYGPKFLGTFAIEEDAARAVYKEAVRNSLGELASLILDTHHVRNMPSYAAERFAAIYPEGVEGSQLRNRVTSKRPGGSQRPSSPQNKERSIRQAGEPNQDSTSPSAAAASAFAAPPIPGAAEQLPGSQIYENIEVSPGALITDRSWGAYQEPRTRYRHAACTNLMAARHLQSSSHQLSNAINTLTPQPPRNLLPKFVRAPAATAAASSSCHAPSVPSIPRATGEASSSGVTKFKLFNVEISVAVEPRHGGDRTEAHGESEPHQLISPPRKMCKITGAEASATHNPRPRKLCKKCLLAKAREG